MTVQGTPSAGTMQAWVLGDPGEVKLIRKQVPEPGSAELLLRVEAAAICGTDLEVIRHGLPALIDGQLPFNKNHVLGHEFAGTVARLGADVDEFAVGDRVVVEVHAGCGRCERCRRGMYTSCLNYGRREKGHRANGFTTDGAFAEYTVNHVNTVFALPDHISFEAGTLAVTAGTSMYALDVLGGLVAGETIVVSGPGPIGLMTVACAKALGARVILTGTRDARLELGRRLGADAVVNVRRENVMETVKHLTHGGADLVVECSGAPDTLNEGIHMLRRGAKMCLAAFGGEPSPFDAGYLVRNNLYLYGIRGEGQGAVRRGLALIAQGRIDCAAFITHRFRLADLPDALHTAEHRVDDAVKVVVTP